MCVLSFANDGWPEGVLGGLEVSVQALRRLGVSYLGAKVGTSPENQTLSWSYKFKDLGKM